jgi:glutathione S-transferase
VGRRCSVAIGSRPEIELYQFAGSHFNEKARWALDLKDVSHQRRSLMPGPHMFTMKRLTGGTETPALVDGDAVVPGSTAILEHLERRFPEPALFPDEEEDRERAVAIVRRWDAEVGPAVRLAKFFDVLEPAYALGTFCRDHSSLSRALYRVVFPGVAVVMKRMMAIDATNAAEAREVTREALDFVAKEPGVSGYLVGDRFSVADLTCAALLMPCVAVEEWGGPADPPTERNREWLARWGDHPGAKWVREIYRRHRRLDVADREAPAERAGRRL